MGIAAILVMWPDHLNKLSFPHPKESPYEIWVQLAQWFHRRGCLKMLTDDEAGRWSHWYTNSSPRSLRLRWAKNKFPTDQPKPVKQGRVRGNKNIFKVGLSFLESSYIQISELFERKNVIYFFTYQFKHVFRLILKEMLTATCSYNFHISLQILIKFCIKMPCLTNSFFWSPFILSLKQPWEDRLSHHEEPSGSVVEC